MTDLLLEFARLAPLMVWAAVATALTMAAAVVVERAAFGLQQALNRRITQRYRPLVRRALDGRRNGARRAAGQPRATSARDRVAADRTAHRGSRPGANRQDSRDRAGACRCSARRPLPAEPVVVAARARAARARAHSSQGPHASARRRARRCTSGRAGRRARRPDGHARPGGGARHRRAACTTPPCIAAGAARRSRRSDPSCEPFLLELSEVDPANRLNYIHALAICGTSRSRPVLCRWTRDSRVEVRAAAFEALAYVGLDDDAARVAIEGLESDDPQVRAMAAYALRGWQGPGDAAARLARASRRYVGGRRQGRANASVHGAGRRRRAAGARIAPRPRRPARAPDAVAAGRSSADVLLARRAHRLQLS